MMPEVDGYTVLQTMKADPALSTIPIVMVSAIDEVANVARCIEMGADDYLTKPYDPVLLQARVTACLDKRRLRDSEADAGRGLELLARAAEQVEAGTYDDAPVAAEVIDDAPVAAEVIAAEVIDEPVAAEVFEAEVLPAAPEVPKAVAAFAPTPAATIAYPPPSPPVAPPPAPKADIEATGTFSLDSGLPLPVPAAKPVPAAAPPAPAAPAALAGAGLFSLDADDHQPAPPQPAAVAPPKSTPALSGIAEVPAVRSLPASGKRPRLKITMVKPGEKSPLAK
jgi:hypothetical protein